METNSYPSLHAFLAELDEFCLLLARHGETDWNARGIIQGQQDRPLSLKGFEQRKNLFYLLHPIMLGRIICSQLQRTIQTALPISVENGLPLEQKAEFNEARLGIFEGQFKNEFADEFSRATYQAFLDDEINIILPGGGESLKMVDARVSGLVSAIVADVADAGHTLIVGHRNVNKMIVRNLLDLNFEEGYQVEHKNDWLYLFAPQQREIFLIEVPSPTEPIQVHAGYETIAATSSAKSAL